MSYPSGHSGETESSSSLVGESTVLKHSEVYSAVCKLKFCKGFRGVGGSSQKVDEIGKG